MVAIIFIIITGMILPHAFSENTAPTIKSNEIETLPYNGTQFNLKINETFSTESGTFKIKLINVTSDSRCPDTAYCIWQGEVTVSVGITQGNQNLGNFSLSTLSGHDRLVSGKYVLLLTQVKPSVSIGREISPSDYVITFVISYVPVEPPLKQFRSGIAAENIQCKSNLKLVFKAKDSSPACVTSKTAQNLVERGWAKSISETQVGSTGSSTKIITLDQNNQQINLQKGQRLLLNLGSNYDWSLNIDNNTVLSRVPNVMVMQGAQGLFEAHNAGKTALVATGDPICLKATPRCGMPSILFKVIIVVS